jgi:pyridoxamine 5'-phosphate oxidase
MGGVEAAGLMSEPVPLREADVLGDPVAQFARWFEQARSAGLRQPEAMAVATADASGAPSVRMVLMKRFGPDGFVFFTHFDSRKGAELAANPRAALLFHWEALGRQVRIEGPAAPVSFAEISEYVHSRPVGSQISALASPQSQVVPDRAWLEERVAALRAQFGDAPPVPERWGGFRVAGERFEFWQHREDRLHDRIVYAPEVATGGWRIERLAP